MKIVGLSGKRSSGKTTLAELMRLQYGWNHLSLATPIKDLCKTEFAFNDAQVNGALKESPTHLPRKGGEFYTPRDVMIRIGFMYREINENYWINKLMPKMEKTAVNVISDVRFKNEADWIKEHGGYVIRLERDPKLSIYKGEINDASEIELDSYDFHCTLPAELNNNLDQLKGFSQYLADFVYMDRGGITGRHGVVFQGC